MKKKVLYMHFNSESGNPVVNGIEVPREYFQMFTVFLSNEVYKCPIKYHDISELEDFCDFLDDENEDEDE